MSSFDFLIWLFPLLILLCIYLVKYLKNIGVPSLIIFLGIGILAGQDGIGGLVFNNAELAKTVGIICLVFILFAGGLDTSWKEVKKQAPKAIVLSTIGVLFTAAIVAVGVYFILGVDWPLALLLGAIVSSTDAAAVFALLRASGVQLKSRLQNILELESGTNDPMAVFLTVVILDYLTGNLSNPWHVPLLFLMQMGFGFLFGAFFGRLYVYLINKLKSPFGGFYPVFGISFSLLIYGFTSFLGGSGFLAVYVAALIISEFEFIHKKSILRFFDGLSWLSQIIMFLVLGLLVIPTEIPEFAFKAGITALILIFIARPASVFITMLPFRLNFKEMVFISWVGLRGAVPIIMATYALLSGIVEASFIFNIVFFVVLSSVLLQGWTLPLAAKWLKVTSEEPNDNKTPMDFIPEAKSDEHIIDIKLDKNASVLGRQIVNIPFPESTLIILIIRDGRYIVPTGSTVLEKNDVLQLLLKKQHKKEIIKLLTDPHVDGKDEISILKT